jgi:hypothetical protein
MHINVTVEAEKNLQFVFKNDDEVVDHVKVDTDLVEVDSTGWMYLFCNATGYPDPRYNWTFIINNITHDISEDACLSPSSTGEVRTRRYMIISFGSCAQDGFHILS